LKPGKYSVAVNVHSWENGLRWKSNTVAIDLEELDSETRKTIKVALAPKMQEVGSNVRDWINPNVNVPLLKQKLPRRVFSAFSPYAFINATLREGKIALAPTELLELFPDQLKAYAELLRFEVLLGQGRSERAEVL